MNFLKVVLELITKGVLSKEAVLLYSYLTGLNRMSEKDNIKDKENRTVVFCATDKAMEILNISKSTALKIFKELEEANYIKRVRRGQGKASYIYVIQHNKEEEENTDIIEANSEYGVKVSGSDTAWAVKHFYGFGRPKALVNVTKKEGVTPSLDKSKEKKKNAKDIRGKDNKSSKKKKSGNKKEKKRK